MPDEIGEHQRIGNKIKRAYKGGGILRIAVNIYKTLKRYLLRFHTSYWYIRKLNEEFKEIGPNIKVSINYNAMQETFDWERDHVRGGMFYSEAYKEVNAALENNHDIVNVSHNDKIIGFLKVGLSKVYIKEYIKVLEIPQNTAFIYNTFICEDYRGLGIATYMVNEVMKKLSKNGLKFIMCFIVPDNLASQRAYAKIGFKRINYIWHLRLFGLRLFNLSPEKLMYDATSK